MDVKGDFMLRLFFWVLAGGVAVAQIQIDLRAQARGGGSGDFAPSKTSGTVITIGAGSFRYGTNFVNFPSPMTFTLQTVPISSIVSGSATTTINTAVPMVNLVNGQAISVQLSGTGPGCAAGSGIFVATAGTTTQFTIPAKTSAGCTGVSGTVGAQ